MPDLRKYYTVGRWHDIPQYRCKLCNWDTVDGRTRMIEHLQSDHPVEVGVIEQKTSPGGILLARKDGKPKNEGDVNNGN